VLSDEVYWRRRGIIVAGLYDIPGVSCLEPPGACYVFSNIVGTGHPAELQAGLLKNAGVAALAGTASGRPVRCGLPAVLLRELGRE
jgi:aspartate/methionine/tyrosine aminotransferase